MQSNKKDQHWLSLQLQEQYVNGQTQAELVLCQRHNCLNPLRNRDGSAFYFQDHAEAYNTFTQKSGTGETVKHALLGIAALASAAGTVLLIRHGLIARKLDKHFPIVDAAGEKVKFKLFGSKDTGNVKYHVSAGDDTLSAEQAKALNDKSNKALGAGFVAASIGTVAWMTAFAGELATSRHWRRKQADFKRLFVQGERIAVNKQQLATLLEVMNKKLGVQTAPEVARFLYTK